MIITHLLLRNYKRLLLSNISLIELDFTSAIQVILGTNGSGKSSILSELTPYPGYHKHFTTGGEKFIRVEHEQSVYELRSIFDRGTGTHTFKKDGVELNEGYTYAVQRELVLREFGIDKEVVGILTGKIRFSRMPTEKRRQWLSRLAPFDLSYAYKAYANAKEKHRDQVAIIRHASKRMTLEHSDALDVASIHGYRQQIKEITKTLDTLFKWRSNTSGVQFTPDELRSRLTRLVNQLQRAIRTLPELPLNHTARSQSDLVRASAEAVQLYESKRAVLEHLQGELHSLENDHSHSDVFISAEDATKLTQQRDVLKAEIEVLVAKEFVTVLPVCTQAVTPDGLQHLESLGELLLNLFADIPDNADGHYSRDKGQAAKELSISLNRARQEWTNQYQSASTRLSQLRGCPEVVCPKCTHTWRMGVDPVEVESLKQQRAGAETRLEQTESAIRKNDEYLLAFEEYYGYVRKFRNITETYPTYHKLWDWLLENKVVYTSPRHYIVPMTDWLVAQRLDARIMDLTNQLAVCNRKLGSAQVLAAGQLSEKDRQLQQLHNQIDQAVVEATEARIAHAQASALADQFELFVSGAYDVLKRGEEFLDDFKHWTEFEFQSAVYAATDANHQRLGVIQGIVTRNDQQAAILEDLKDQHESAVQDHVDYGLLVKALSPTGGLIGQYLLGFMQQMVKLLNAIVAKVWTYPMEVLPSAIEREDLNYRFPLDIQNQTILTDDIEEGSTAQVDMIDFSFQLVAMRFLGLSDFPLLLDELGNTFDETHRVNIINLIENLLELKQVRQVFFISHYASQHGALSGAEICVLDDRNISVPGVYNKHVKME